MQTNIQTYSGQAGFLTDNEMRRVAPSLFAPHAAPGTSDRYQYVSTVDIINTMRKAGYEPVKAGQSLARTGGSGLFNRHVVRMMHRDFLDPSKRNVGDVVPQVILQNSHNRTSAFHLGAGLERLVCSNGLAVSVAQLSGLRVLHNDVSIHDHILEGLEYIREVTETIVTPQVEAMTAKVLSKAMQRDFAQAVTVLKFGEARNDHVDSLLSVRRAEDEGDTLWTVLNRVQENAIRGGYDATDASGRHIKAKPIAAIARDLDFNLDLWTLGAKMLELA
jgi:hypothetical protein